MPAMVLPSVMKKLEKYRFANQGLGSRRWEQADPMHACHVDHCVPSFQASQPVRAAGINSLEEEMCVVRRVVRHVDNGCKYLFKAVYDLPS